MSSEKLLKLKEIYIILRKKHEISAKIEYALEQNKITEMYRNIHDKSLTSDLISFNYKVVFGALYTADKFNNVKNNNKCVLCCKCKETCKHIFSECAVTIKLYEQYKHIYITLNYYLIWLITIIIIIYNNYNIYTLLLIII